MADEIPLAPEPRPQRKQAIPHGAKLAADEPPRRGFFSKLLAMLIGLFLMVVPIGAGILAFVEPLRRRIQAGGGPPLIRVTTLDALPADGTPVRFPVIADRQDAWTRYVNVPIGAVYIRRVPGGESLQVFNVTCPHAGCAVSFDAAARRYVCPCHTSAFEIDGTLVPGVPPRNLDSLEYEIRTVGGRQEVWVAYQKFFPGSAEQKAMS